MSVTITTAPQPQPLRSQPQPVQAVVVYTESDGGGVVSLPIAPVADKPSWLTDELLAGPISGLFRAYLCHNPNATGAELTQWARQYVDVCDSYARIVISRSRRSGGK